LDRELADLEHVMGSEVEDPESTPDEEQKPQNVIEEYKGDSGASRPPHTLPEVLKFLIKVVKSLVVPHFYSPF
jgi:hypothetical protein